MFTADDNDGSDFGNGATESGEPCGQQSVPANILRRPDSSVAGSTVNQPPAPFRTGTKHKQKECGSARLTRLPQADCSDREIGI
jgi:hypothetical protein